MGSLSGVENLNLPGQSLPKDMTFESALQLAGDVAVSQFRSCRHSILLQLLGPLYTPELQQRLQSCTTVEDLFPVFAEKGQAEMSAADAAAVFVLPPRSSATEDANHALEVESRILAGHVTGQAEIETLWVNKQEHKDPETLPATSKHLLKAAAVLQGSSELASAGSLPYDAELLKALQRSTTVQIAHSITAADILGMPRQDLPALLAALWAAEDCMARLIGCSHSRMWGAELIDVSACRKLHSLLSP
jgi:hypothetical protein